MSAQLGSISQNSISQNERNAMSDSKVRPFRWFRVKYSPRYVDTSVGHVCLFTDKRYVQEAAIEDGEGAVTFADLYTKMSYVAYLMRHLVVRNGSRAYLDAGEGRASLIGMLGALRGGCTVVAPGKLLDPAERDAIIAAYGCTVVLSVRPETLSLGDGVIVVDLSAPKSLHLAKELDWGLPRPLPHQIALIVPVTQADGTKRWHELANGPLSSYLRADNDGGPLEDEAFGAIPNHDTLRRMARHRSDVPTASSYG